MTKKRGAIIPNPIDTEGTRKIVVCIPDTVEWLSLFTGLVSQLRYGWYWDRTTGDLDAIRDRAKRVYFEMQDQNGECMALDCDEVADCIENSENVHDKLRAFLAEYDFDNGTPGNPMPQTIRDQAIALGFNPSCDLDIVWSQAVKFVTRCDEFITDLLQSLSEASTAAGIADVLAQLPLIENLGLTSLTSLSELLVGLPLAAYADDFDIAYKEALYCEIFCTAKTDCEIRFQNIWTIFKNRVEPTIPALGDFPLFGRLDEWYIYLRDYITPLIALNKADVMFYLICGGLEFGNVIINQAIPSLKLLETALALAADEPSNDWETLCLSCPSYEDLTYDMLPLSDGMTVDDNGGSFLGGDSIIIYAPMQAEITFSPYRRVHRITVTMAFAEATGNTVSILGAPYDLVRTTHIGGSTYEYTAVIDDRLSPSLDFQFVANDETAHTYVVVAYIVVNVWTID